MEVSKLPQVKPGPVASKLPEVLGAGVNQPNTPAYLADVLRLGKRPAFELDLEKAFGPKQTPPGAALIEALKKAFGPGPLVEALAKVHGRDALIKALTSYLNQQQAMKSISEFVQSFLDRMGFDANKDGKLDGEEQARYEGAKASFKRLDVNGDGTLSPAEFAVLVNRYPPGYEKLLIEMLGPSHPLEGKFPAVDVNGDGKLSESEFLQAIAGLERRPDKFSPEYGPRYPVGKHVPDPPLDRENVLAALEGGLTNPVPSPVKQANRNFSNSNPSSTGTGNRQR